MKLGVILFILAGVATTSNAQETSQNIALINVGLSNRNQVAELITKICSFSPRVVAIDFKFPQAIQQRESQNLYESLIKHGDTITLEKVFEPGEKELNNALWECKCKLVLAYDIVKEVFPGGASFSYSRGSIIEPAPFHAKLGFGLLTGKESVPDLTSFILYQDDSTNTFGGIRVNRRYQFGVSTAMEYDSARTLKFLTNNKRAVAFNYQAGRKKFNSYDISEVLKNKVSQRELAGKIVIIGFMGPGNGDKFFSPWNTSRTQPDIYGIEYYAHIVSQILDAR